MLTPGGLMGDMGGLNVMDGLSSVLQTTIYNAIYKIFYYIDAGLCWIVGILYKVFGIFAGTEPVKYVDEGGIMHEGDLLSFFIGYDSISRTYWYMAVTGIVLCFGFTIIAVIRKMADLDGKQQRAYGQIFRGAGKSILIILLMTSIMTGVLQITNVITDAVDLAFTAGSNKGSGEVEFSDDHYAAMARVLNTVGNYSLNMAPTSRYNINACFNDIRPDLQWLQDQGIFDIYYVDKSPDGSSMKSWQSELQKIVNSADLRRDISMDVYDESLASALTNLMKLMNNDASFKPLASPYKSEYDFSTEKAPLDVILFLMATSDSANNESYNVAPSLTDNLRGGYYVGEKSIYDFDQVVHDFNIAIGVFDHILILFASITMIPNLMICVFNAIARLFNLLMLYLMAPLAIAPTPMDDGGKFKQWTTAFVIQCFGILGIIVSMRLLLLFIPVITGSELVLFDNVLLNLIAKLLLLIGGTEAARKASGIITGILADNAGLQSLAAGDMSDVAGKAMGVVGGVAKGAAGVAADVTGLSTVGNSIKDNYKKMATNGGVFSMFRDSQDVRNAQRQRDINKKLDEREAKKSGGSGNSKGGSPTNLSGNKGAPPTSSEEFNNRLQNDTNESGPQQQQNLNNNNTNGQTPQQQNLNNNESYSSVEVAQAPTTNLGGEQNQGEELNQENWRYM